MLNDCIYEFIDGTLGYLMYMGILVMITVYFILEIWLCCILIRAATEVNKMILKLYKVSTLHYDYVIFYVRILETGPILQKVAPFPDPNAGIYLNHDGNKSGTKPIHRDGHCSSTLKSC